MRTKLKNTHKKKLDKREASDVWAVERFHKKELSTCYSQFFRTSLLPKNIKYYISLQINFLKDEKKFSKFY